MSKNTSGERNCKAKLNWNIVNIIRSEFVLKYHDLRIPDIAEIFSKEYDVGVSTITSVLLNKRWETNDENYINYAEKRYNQSIEQFRKQQGELLKDRVSKLTWEIVDNIRADFKILTERKMKKLTILSKKYNLSEVHIDRVVSNRIWIKNE